jgi:dihydroxy-acid dehydratase
MADGDRIVLDVEKGTIDVGVGDAELGRRREEWEPLPARYTYAVLAKYTKLVGSASVGAICG